MVGWVRTRRLLSLQRHFLLREGVSFIFRPFVQLFVCGTVDANPAVPGKGRGGPNQTDLRGRVVLFPSVCYAVLCSALLCFPSLSLPFSPFSFRSVQFFLSFNSSPLAVDSLFPFAFVSDLSGFALQSFRNAALRTKRRGRVSANCHYFLLFPQHQYSNEEFEKIFTGTVLF